MENSKQVGIPGENAQSSKSKKTAGVLALVVIVGFLVLLVALAGSQKEKQETNNQAAPVPSQVSDSSVEYESVKGPKLLHRMSFYEIEGTTLKQRGSVEVATNKPLEYTHPASPIIDKEGKIYYASLNELNVFDPAENKSTYIKDYDNEFDGYITGLTYVPATDAILTTHYVNPGDEIEYTEEADLTVITASTPSEVHSNNRRSRVIYAGTPLIYGFLEPVSQASEEEIVITNRGGDGCGRFGYVSVADIRTQEVRKIQDIGNGCSDAPRFLGYNAQENSLLFYSVTSKQIGSEEEGYGIEDVASNTVFSINVKNGVRKNLLQLPRLIEFPGMSGGKEDYFSIFYDDKDNRLALIADAAVDVYDLTSGARATYQFADGQTWSAIARYIQGFTGNTLYVGSESSMQVLTLDGKQVKIEEIKGESTLDAETLKELRFATLDNQGKPLFYSVKTIGTVEEKNKL